METITQYVGIIFLALTTIGVVMAVRNKKANFLLKRNSRKNGVEIKKKDIEIPKDKTDDVVQEPEDIDDLIKRLEEESK